MVFVVTGPSGVGKGTLIAALRERHPELALSVSATTRAPRAGEEDGVDYHFLTEADFDRRLERGEFVEHATYAGHRYGTLRAELERRSRGGAPVVLEIELQGARQIRAAIPEAVAVSSRPPRCEELRERLRVARHRRPRRRRERLAVARTELAAATNSARRGQRRPRAAVADLDAFYLRYAGWVISPRIDNLLDHVDSNYASVIVAAKRARQINSYYQNLGEGSFDEFPPPMVDTGSKNYLTIALEEVAAGKLKYHYR